ncbi:squalene--hopene cyclase [Sporolactobacillus sp. CQH2019]|uniref:squalene--hopene cyclase n=1 Tax=Sporolactobacillus sp. CQH2019 TaxID=3023512 RepID=UPI002368684C|nr:squalene--hopene cyclase [Sporolactobacillus sp. CQH2019]MDD9149174.1 squalene--hopene cyclase [Sporolactobacillus sp. CQH2019]
MAADVSAEISRIVRILIRDQLPNGSWNYPFETGIVTDCYFIILLRSLEIREESLIQALAERIVQKQERNGSWKLFYDETDGNLSATVEAYTALLYSGYRSKDDDRIQAAKHFIRANGGLKKTNTFTKIMLALIGQYDWSDLFQIPVEAILLPPSFPVSFFDLSVFTRANFAPILILSDRRYHVKTSMTPDLSDQDADGVAGADLPDSDPWQPILALIRQGIQVLSGQIEPVHTDALEQAEHYMLKRIEADGTLECYFSATFLMVFALLARGYSKGDPVISRAVRGLKSMICRIKGYPHVQYTTATVWNTALIGSTLQEAGIADSSEMIRRANHYLWQRRHRHAKFGDWAIHNPEGRPGGWGFSDANTINPDVDDTAAVLRSIRFSARENETFRRAWDRGIQWVVSMQNSDGGWPAFEKGIDKPYLVWLPIEQPQDILLDPSSPDLTGRTLNFFGECTDLDTRNPLIGRGIDWLLRNQEKDGSWIGRWGICFIYGTWGAVTGLTAAGVKPEHSAVRRAAGWLRRIQNPDGGWGESCKSDVNKHYTALGASTRTHTAWALDALISSSAALTPEIERGIQFLIAAGAAPDWTADYPKGRGMAGAFYIHYHSYDLIWPLLALAHFRRKFG